MKIETSENRITSRFEAEPNAGAMQRARPSRLSRGVSRVLPTPFSFGRVPNEVGLLSSITGRRAFFATLVSVTVVILAGWLGYVLAADGISVLDGLLIGALVIEAFWTVHNAWNAIIGFVSIRILRRSTDSVFPPAARAHDGDAVFARTAILMTLRNEDCDPAFARMRAIKESLDAQGYGGKFDYFILSDSTTPEAIEAEEAAIKAWRAQASRPGQIRYRRRALNVGFKAGNVYDFCERFGRDYDYMIPLDADSVMAGKTIMRLVRIMQANPKIGLLQSLISGIPSKSFFERLLHFGPRHNARLFIFGSSWWQADCGPFWGHNALIRVAPFTEHCRLPILKGKPPLGGHILSHDQVEAVMMRRAGYEVRVLPEEQGSYEDNPPTVLDFLQRHLRWCRGNLQYMKLRHEPGMLVPKSTHFYLWLALELFFSMAGMVAFTVMAALAAANWSADVAFPVWPAALLFATWLGIYFLPKFIGTLDAFLYAPHRYGGRLKLAASSALDTLSTFMLTPIANVVCALYMFGLIFGRQGNVTWDGQRRESYSISWATAARALWPVTAFGVALTAFIAFTAPAALPWFMPFVAGLLLAIPFTVVTSWPWLGELAAEKRILALPEEIEAPPELAAILPWLQKHKVVTEPLPGMLPHAVPITAAAPDKGSRMRTEA